MAILVDKDSRIIVQGITGAEGSFHAEQCLAYGDNVVGGVTPGKGGQTALEGKVPVFDSCAEAREQVSANVSLILFHPRLRRMPSWRQRRRAFSLAPRLPALRPWQQLPCLPHRHRRGLRRHRRHDHHLVGCAIHSFPPASAPNPGKDALGTVCGCLGGVRVLAGRGPPCWN